MMCLALPQDVLARPDVSDPLEWVGDKTPPPFPGPDRPRLSSCSPEAGAMSSGLANEQVGWD